MKKSEIGILVVEDDPTQGKALAEALQRAGYQTTLTNSGPKGLQLSRNREFHAVLADCMLPKMNGVDLAIEITAQSPRPPKIFLMSGIFKDKNFIKNSIDKTGALAFFVKPLDLADLIRRVDESFGDIAEEVSASTSDLVRLYREDELHAAALLHLILHESTMPSVHLPMLYKRLQETDVSGDLGLVFENGAMHTITFYKGRIASVRTPDKETYFGALAVGLGFVSPEEVLEALNGPPGKLLGQRLIDSMLLSPHAIGLILEEQLALRLSQTVQPGMVSMQWMAKRLAPPEYALNANRFVGLLGDWSRSKVDAAAIRAPFALWGTYRLQGHYHPDINDAVTVDDLLAHGEFVDAADLGYFYRQLLEGNATLGERAADSRNFAFLEHRLAQLADDHKTQNYYQVLGVSEKAHHLELNKAMEEMRQHFDPANLPADLPAPIRAQAERVFAHIVKAHQTLNDDDLRMGYQAELSKKRSQEFMEHEPLFKQAVQDLSRNHADRALKPLETIIAKKIEFKDVRAFYLWAGLKQQGKSFRALSLEQIPPEERHSAAYHMAKGVWHRQAGQTTKALECFRTANVLDPRLSIARAEVTSLREEIETRGQSTVVLRDVTSVMDNILGSRKRGA